MKRKVVFWERQIEENEGRAYTENAVMDCFVLCHCKEIPLGLEISDEDKCTILPPMN